MTMHPPAPDITRLLAEYTAHHPSGGWPDEVEREAHRAFLNWLGCAVGAARHPTLDAALAGVRMLAPSAQATVLGREARVDVASAALLNGISSHTFDFDDTHAATLIHPSGPVMAAALALAEHLGRSGRELVDAIVIGIDVSCRAGLGLFPEHYDRGWHITGTAGPLGAAAACARLLRLDAGLTAMALSLAASQPIGLRDQFGSMAKPFHPGAAARAGLMAAVFAQHGYTASPQALQARRGYFHILTPEPHWDRVLDQLGTRFELMRNTYKPYACGVVMHPGIDGCVQLRAHGVPPAEIDRIELRAHPLVLELTGKPSPRTGLEGKFSIFHGCAVGYRHGRAGEAEFSDEAVNDAATVALRDRIVAIVSDDVGETSADVTLHTLDGRRLHTFVRHASGSLQQPMTDEQLERKFDAQVAPLLGEAGSARLRRLCAGLGRADGVRALCEAAVPA